MIGFKDIALRYFTRIPSSSDEDGKSYIEETKSFTDQIFDCKLGEIGQIGMLSC